MFAEQTALRSDLENYIKKFNIEPSDLKNLNNIGGLMISAIEDNIWKSFSLSKESNPLTIPLRNSKGNLVGNIAESDNELVTLGQVKSIIKNPFTPKGSLQTVNELPSDGEVGWLYIIESDNNPVSIDYNPNYPSLNSGTMVILLEADDGTHYWEAFTGFIGSDLTLDNVLMNGNISEREMFIGNKLTVASLSNKVELNTQFDNGGFLNIQQLTNQKSSLIFGIKNWNETTSTRKILFKNSPTNIEETVAFESDIRDFVSYTTTQNRTDVEKALARQNLGVDNLNMNWTTENW